ncbi:MAG: NfeD family protein [Clostridiales bacterium]|nr:NfeD family protein [Clostridiales bacterium]
MGIRMGDVIGYLIFWVIAFIIFAVAEAISVRLIAIWFAVGSIAAFIATLIDMPFWMQIIVFFFCSFLLLIVTRPLTKKLINQNVEGSNADCLIEKIGTVIERIDNQRAMGRVSVNGMEWAARSCDDTIIAVDEKVTIESIDGVKVMVTKLMPQKLPENL